LDDNEHTLDYIKIFRLKSEITMRTDPEYKKILIKGLIKLIIFLAFKLSTYKLINR
jgi:hypothetical protein